MTVCVCAVDVQRQSICTDVLNNHQAHVFTRAVRDHYWCTLALHMIVVIYVCSYVILV